METSHYPSLDLCRKLTEIGFPKTEKYWDSYATEKIVNGYGITSDGEYVCPSVMELLDVIPAHIDRVYCFSISKTFNEFCEAGYMLDTDVFNVLYRTCAMNLPNALAEVVLYLHDNGFVKFK